MKTGSLQLLVSATLLILTSCSHVFYQPAGEQFFEPKKAGINYEDVQFKSLDGVILHGWYFPAELKKGALPKGAVIQFHGNAENISTHFASLVWLIKEGYDFFTFDYRGYGASAGDPDQEGVNKDALAAIQYVYEKFPAGKSPNVVLFGQSLGGAVVMRAFEDLKDRSRVRAIVVDSTFHSYKNIARVKLGQFWLTYLLQPLGCLLVSDAYAPKDFIPQIAPTPMLVIHGDEDNVVPVDFGEEIFGLAKEPKAFWKIKGGHHIDSMVRHEGKYRQKFLEYLESLSK